MSRGASRFKLPSGRSRPFGLLLLGLAAGIVVSVKAKSGADLVPFWWLVSMGLAGLFFLVDQGVEIPRWKEWREAALPGAILLLLLPLYTAWLYDFPSRINSDEIIFINMQKDLLNSRPQDWLGLTSLYYYHPRFIFLLTGEMARLIGGVDVFHMRLVAAFFGLAIVAFSYPFFRLTMTPWPAAAAMLVLGASHVLIMLSRMAMWNNTALFFLLISLGCLSRGLLHRSAVWSFWGGIAAGLCFYTYSSARLILLMWPVAWLVRFCFFRPAWRPRILWAQLWPAVLGLALAVQPILWAAHRAGPAAAAYSRRQFLVLPEGRVEQKGWTYQKTTREAVWFTIGNGLSAFNSRKWDMGNMYPNQSMPGMGFLDPFTGLFLWIGVGALLAGGRFRFHREQDVTVVAMFIVSWLFFALIINKSPSYPRLLVTLPLVCYLAVAGLRAAALQMKSWSAYFAVPPDRLFRLTALTGLLAIAAGNATIFENTLRRGMESGDDWGDTARLLHARRWLPHYHYFMIGDQSRPYYYWGQGYWYAWTEGFLGKNQTLSIMPPELIAQIADHPPYMLLMSRTVFNTASPAMSKRNPAMTVTPITPDGRLVAVEVQPLFHIAAVIRGVPIHEDDFIFWVRSLPPEERRGDRRRLLRRYAVRQWTLMQIQGSQQNGPADVQASLRRASEDALLKAWAARSEPIPPEEIEIKNDVLAKIELP